MDYKIIGLGVLVIILIYILYVYYYLAATTNLVASTNLLKPNSNITIKDNPSSVRYTYNVWIYVNNAWSGKQPIFVFDYKTPVGTYGTNKSGGLGRAILTTDSAWNKVNEATSASIINPFMLYLSDIGGSSLCCIIPDNPSAAADPSNPFTITNNFPLQTWVYVTVSVDSQYVDFYINGKLVKSVQLQGVPVVPLTGASPANTVQLGKGADINIAALERLSNPSGPQDVWAAYLKGSPASSTAPSSYKININLLKDKALQKSYDIF